MTAHAAADDVLSVAVSRLGVDGLRAAAAELARLVEDEGIRYGGEGAHWSIDPLPLVISAGEWATLEAGLKQRARLLDLVLRDLYGEQRLLSSGAIPAEVVWGHPGFLHRASGLPEHGEGWLPLIATDLGRETNGGAWHVIADRTDTPAGVGYAMATRRLLTRAMPDLHEAAPPARLRSFFSGMRAGVLQSAPRPGHTPRGVLLWSGAGDETAYEQGFLATLLGYALVEAEDLLVREGQVWVSSPDGRSLVDVIVRRVPAALADPLEFRSDSQLGVAGLLEAARLGTVSVLNPLGSGVLENPAVLGLLPALAPQLLGEELAIRTPETWWCGDPAQRSHVIANLDRLVIKPLGRGTAASRAGWELDGPAREALRARIAAEPWAWCGQQPIDLAAEPTVGVGGLEPRPVVLRAFGARVDGEHHFLPGGLARAASADRFRISASDGALAKDVWVLDPADSQEAWARTFDGVAAVQRVRPPAPRVADNLVWYGRYAERVDGTSRLLRGAADLAQDHGRRPGSRGAQALAAVLHAGERVTGMDLSSGDVTLAMAHLRSAVTGAATRGSVAHSVRRLLDAAAQVPDIMSGDVWHVLGRLERLVERGHRQDLAGMLGDVITQTLAVGGINAESLTRDVTWAFVDAGTRLERAQWTVALLRHTLGTPRAVVVESQVAEALLSACESLITHRRRAASGDAPDRPAVAAAHLLVVDRTNPRSAAYQLDRLAADLGLIGDEELAARASARAENLASADLDALFSGDRAAAAQAMTALHAGLRDLAGELHRRHLVRSAPRRPTLSDWWSGAPGEEH